MSAEDNLSAQLFHGTDADLKVGDVVKPTKGWTGKTLSWASTSPNYAWDFASVRRSNNPNNPMFGSIYTVEPVDEKEMQKTSNKDTVGMSNLFRASKKGFKVTGLHGLAPQEDQRHK